MVSVDVVIDCVGMDWKMSAIEKLKQYSSSKAAQSTHGMSLDKGE